MRFLPLFAVVILVASLAAPVALAVPAGCPSDKPYIVNPLTGSCAPVQPYELYARVIRVFLTLIGSISLLFSIYGGFLWLTSAGETEKIKQGRDTILWAILGVAAALLSYAVLNFLIGSVLP